MPRPPDTYTHSQFASIDPNNEAGLVETGRCVHCNTWKGNIRNLARKKDHLLACPQYAAWRAAGNGRDIAPHNSYTKRDSIGVSSQQQYNDDQEHSSQYTPETNKAGPGTKGLLTGLQREQYEEYFDETQKCVRVRCKHCGFVRAKNATRQVEHLLNCNEFLATPEGQAAKASGDVHRLNKEAAPTGIQQSGSEIWRGKAPNPDLSASRRGPDKRPRLSGNASTPSRPVGPPRPTPSLATHLLSRESSAVTSATQQPFLSHAGCGTLSASALQQWLTQDHHISRAFVSFIGGLISKCTLPSGVANSQQNTSYRVMDLLISTINNVRREMSFFEATAQKFGLQIGRDDPKPITKAYLDLFAGASSERSSLLEGIVVLWATEHLYRTSWHHASTFSNMKPSSNYSLPSYLTTGAPGSSVNPYDHDTAAAAGEPHLAALHQALVPNWTSPAFSKFVDACRGIVDELANSQTSGNGREEMARCETVFRQAVWLWERLWPAVDGMGGDQEELERNNLGASHSPGAKASSRANGSAGTAANNGDPIEVQDDEDDDNDGGEHDAHGESMDSPFGGTGLGAVHASNLEAA